MARLDLFVLVGAIRLDTASTYNGFGELATNRAEAVVSATNPEIVIAEINTHVGTIRDIVGNGFEIYPG